MYISPEKASLEDRGPQAGVEAASALQGAGAAGAAHGDPPAAEVGERVLPL